MPTVTRDIDDVPSNMPRWLAEFVPGVIPTSVRISSRPVYRLWGRRHPPLLLLLSPLGRWLVKGHVLQVEVDY